MLRWWFVVLGACGGGSSSGIDATEPDPRPDAADPLPFDAPEAINAGFVRPMQTLRANTEVEPGVWMEVGPADLACLGPDPDPPTTIAVSLAVTVRDFQSG